MAIVMRTASDDLLAYLMAAAMDEHGVRIVAIVPPSSSEEAVTPREMWRVFGQAEHIDHDAIDDTFDRLLRRGERP